MPVRIFAGKNRYQEIHPFKRARLHSLQQVLNLTDDVIMKGSYPSYDESSIKLYNLRTNQWETFDIISKPSWESHLAHQVEKKGKKVIIVLDK